MAKTKFKIRKGDTVQLISGATQANGGDRGKQGKVIAVYPDTQRVLVEGVNRVTKHTKVGQGQRGAKTGGLVHTEAPVHISNVMIVDPETKKPTRVGYRTEIQERGGRERTVRIRVAKRSGKDL